MTRRTVLTLWWVLLAALILTGLGVRLSRAEPTVPLRAGEVAPYAGILMPGEVVRALLLAQDERDTLVARAALTAERHRIDLAECRGISDARERARVACEASRVPPACAPVQWGGWPVVSGVAGAALGFGVGWAVTR